jgi:hypothetical protein
MRHGKTPRAETAYSKGVSAASKQEHSSRSSSQDETPRDTKSHQTATKSATFSEPSDPELALVMDAWGRLPEAMRAGILAMVKASEGASSK